VYPVRRDENACKTSSENLMGRRYFGDLSIDGREILKWILRERTVWPRNWTMTTKDIPVQQNAESFSSN
jgi:hypothetical protein